MRYFLMFINAVCGLFLTIKKFKSGKCFSSQLIFVSHYKKCDFENEYIERAEKVSAIVSIRRGRGAGRAFVTGSQLLPIIFLPTFACYWSSLLAKSIVMTIHLVLLWAIHFEFWGRPFSLVFWKVTRLFATPPLPQTGGKPVGNPVKLSSS